MTDAHAVTSLEALEALYGEPARRSLDKEQPRLTPAYRRWLESATFVAVASSGPDGLDCTPRGDPCGSLVQVLDNRTLVLPDRRGNNRLDTLRNIVADPRVALLFLTSGVNEALRIAGDGVVSTDPDLRERCAFEGRLPATVLIVAIKTVYFQCARALMRAGMWDVATWMDPADVPSAGAMLRDAAPDIDAEAYDRDLVPRQKASLY